MQLIHYQFVLAAANQNRADILAHQQLMASILDLK